MKYVSHIQQPLRALRRQLLPLLLALSAGSAAAAEPMDIFGRRISPFADVPRMTPTWHYRWERVGRSGEGRPIETMRIGRGPFRTLVVGSLHGRETKAIAIANRLATHLGTMPDHWHEFNVLIVKTPNPDGYANHSNRNSRGIDLNRNFPATRLSQGKPFSLASMSSNREAETQTLLKLIEQYRPQRIVHIKSTPNATGWALCNQQAQATASYLGKFRNLHVGKLDQHLTAGSLEQCASNTLNLETITVAVPNRAKTSEIWRDHRNAVIAAAAYVGQTRQTVPTRTPSTHVRKSPALPVQRWRRGFFKRR